MKSVSAQWNLCTLRECLHDCVVWCPLGSYVFVAPRWLKFEVTIIRLSSFTILFSMLDSVSVTRSTGLDARVRSLDLRDQSTAIRIAASTKTIAQKMKLTAGQHRSNAVFNQPGNTTIPRALGLCYLRLQLVRPRSYKPSLKAPTDNKLSRFTCGILMATKLSRTQGRYLL